MQAEESLHAIENRKNQKDSGNLKSLHKRRNWSVQIEELIEMINPTVSVL